MEDVPHFEVLLELGLCDDPESRLFEQGQFIFLVPDRLQVIRVRHVNLILKLELYEPVALRIVALVFLPITKLLIPALLPSFNLWHKMP